MPQLSPATGSLIFLSIICLLVILYMSFAETSVPKKMTSKVDFKKSIRIFNSHGGSFNA